MPEIITQQPKKIKNYKESKAADCTLQLDTINRHILLKQRSQCNGIKILNSKKYDTSLLNLTRSSIKNKLFEISEEIREFKFQHHLPI